MGDVDHTFELFCGVNERPHPMVFAVVIQHKQERLYRRRISGGGDWNQRSIRERNRLPIGEKSTQSFQVVFKHL
jgi:hypothetical protein